MKKSSSIHRPPWRRLALALGLAGLTAALGRAPAQAQSFYETGRPFYLGMGDSHADVPGAAVDLPTGAVRVRFPLLALPGRVHHQVAWYFNSQDASHGPLGQGTALSTSLFMTVPPGGFGFDLVAPGHRAFHFEFNYTDNAYEDSRDPELLGAQFIAGSPPPSGTLTLKNGDQELFDNAGNLYQLQDRYHNFLSINAGTGFTRAISAGGIYYPRADFTYVNGQVSQITYTYYSSPPAPRAWSVGYDGSARISAVTDPMGGVWHYTWTTYTRSDSKVLPLIATIVTPRGKTVFAALYDSSGRISQYTAADGGVTKFSYSAALGSDGTTTVTDPLNHARQWSYTWPAAPAHETAKFGYRLTSFKDALGRQTQYAATQAGSNLITHAPTSGYPPTTAAGSPPRTGTTRRATSSLAPPLPPAAAPRPRTGATPASTTSTPPTPIRLAAAPAPPWTRPPATSPTPTTPVGITPTPSITARVI